MFPGASTASTANYEEDMRAWLAAKEDHRRRRYGADVNQAIPQAIPARKPQPAPLPPYPPSPQQLMEEAAEAEDFYYSMYDQREAHRKRRQGNQALPIPIKRKPPPAPPAPTPQQLAQAQAEAAAIAEESKRGWLVQKEAYRKRRQTNIAAPKPIIRRAPLPPAGPTPEEQAQKEYDDWYRAEESNQAWLAQKASYRQRRQTNIALPKDRPADMRPQQNPPSSFVAGARKAEEMAAATYETDEFSREESWYAW